MTPSRSAALAAKKVSTRVFENPRDFRIVRSVRNASVGARVKEFENLKPFEKLAPHVDLKPGLLKEARDNLLAVKPAKKLQSVATPSFKAALGARKVTRSRLSQMDEPEAVTDNETYSLLEQGNAVLDNEVDSLGDQHIELPSNEQVTESPLSKAPESPRRFSKRLNSPAYTSKTTPLKQSFSKTYQNSETPVNPHLDFVQDFEDSPLSPAAEPSSKRKRFESPAPVDFNERRFVASAKRGRFEDALMATPDIISQEIDSFYDQEDDTVALRDWPVDHETWLGRTLKQAARVLFLA